MTPSPPHGAASDRWRRIEELCDRALRLVPQERAAFLSTACGADQTLRREVEALLAHEQSAEGFLELPVEAIVAEVLPDAGDPDLAGTRIGDYDIVSRLGAGGMGVVYRGTDRRLGRDVAIKVLPRALQLDEGRLARFEREARLLATVNHSNIGAIYGLVEADGIRALVLELIEGETLAAALARGPFPLQRSLAVGAQIADALDHAHRRGVTHRDLKPSNIMLTADSVKLLDFGIGKWTAGAAERDVPRVSSLTEPDAIVGTIHYMSPEQLEGREIDPRTDLFSFGAVLFEMLTGRPAFDGPSRASVIAAILEGPTPHLAAIPGESGPRLERVVAKCLAKDRDRRWQSARDLGDELKWIADEIAHPQMPEHGASLASPKPALLRSRTKTAMVTAAVVALAAVAWVAWTLRPADSGGVVSTPAVRFVVEPPGGFSVGANYFGVSSDGAQLVYSDGAPSFGKGLLLRRFNLLETIALPGTSRGINPAFSPDGHWVVFVEVRDETPQGFTIRKIRTTGDEPSIVLTAAAPSVTSFSWPTPDTIFFAAVDKPIQRLFAQGGEPTPVTTVRTESEVDHHTPQLLPGGKALLFAVHAKGDRFSIAVQSLESGERRTLIESGFSPQYSPTGHLVFARDDDLFAVPFDADRLELVGTPVPMVQGVGLRPLDGFAAFQVSTAGVLVYKPRPSTARRMLAWVDRAGHETLLPLAPGGFEFPRVSPDGKQVAFAATAEGRRRDIFVFEIASEHKTRVTYAGDNWAPLWTRDGSALVYATGNAGESELVLRRFDNGALVRLGATSNQAFPVTFADERTVIVSERPPTDEWFLSRASMDSPGRLEPLLLHGLAPRWATVSPDGRWIAYVENASLRLEVFIQSFPNPGGRRQVSAEGGRTPVWRNDGKELFYRWGNQTFAVAFDTSQGLTSGKPTPLFERDYRLYFGNSFDYDVAPDGRFLMIKPDPAEGGPGQLNVVLNWAGELLHRVPMGK